MDWSLMSIPPSQNNTGFRHLRAENKKYLPHGRYGERTSFLFKR